jgi:hypothetical protein
MHSNSNNSKQFMSQEEYKNYLQNKLNWKSSKHSKVFKYGSRSNVAALGSQQPMATHYSFAPDHQEPNPSPRQVVDYQYNSQQTQRTHGIKKSSISGTMYIDARGSFDNILSHEPGFEGEQTGRTSRRKIVLNEAKVFSGTSEMADPVPARAPASVVRSTQPTTLRDEDKVPQTFKKHLEEHLEAEKLSPELQKQVIEQNMHEVNLENYVQDRIQQQ